MEYYLYDRVRSSPADKFVRGQNILEDLTFDRLLRASNPPVPDLVPIGLPFPATYDHICVRHLPSLGGAVDYIHIHDWVCHLRHGQRD